MSGCHNPYCFNQKRIEALENYMKIEDRITASDVLIRLNKLELYKDCQIEANTKLSKKINELEITISELVDKIGKIANHYYREKKEPYKCPVCEGEGINKNKLVMDGVKEPSTINLKNPVCHSCEGKGIIWG